MNTNKMQFGRIAAAVAFSAVLSAAPVSAAARDDAIADDLDDAMKLLDGLPDLEGKTDAEVDRMLKDDPKLAQRVDEAEAKVSAALHRVNGTADSNIEQARLLLAGLPDFSGKTDAEIKQILADNPEYARKLEEASRLLSGKSGEELSAGTGSEDGRTWDDGGIQLMLDGMSTNVLDDVYFGALDWCWGGFKGENAEKGDVVIADLKMNADGLRFKFVKDLSEWGVMNPDDHSEALACLFVLDMNGKWVGGKFDWISSSRETRDFKNVYGCYNGWNVATVPNPTMAAFVIVSKNGKRRSNVIAAMWER